MAALAALSDEQQTRLSPHSNAHRDLVDRLERIVAELEAAAPATPDNADLRTVMALPRALLGACVPRPGVGAFSDAGGGAVAGASEYSMCQLNDSS